MAGQIARALAVFRIDEVIIFNDENSDGGGNSQLENILKYLECPQYLRKDFFPIHRDLKFAGVLNPTDMPHHLRAFEESLYREGIVKDHKSSSGNCVAFIGLQKECELDKQDLQAGLRVTVKLLSETKKGIKGMCSLTSVTTNFFGHASSLLGQVVTPRTPCEENGLYWGYKVRSCSSLSSVFTKSPYKGGYDFTIGTSERGQDIDQVGSLRDFKHLLIVFGGVKGLEAALQVDSQLKVEDPEPLFDLYLNTCPDQGSRTIRSEEAILISLSALRPKIWNSSAE